MIAPPSVCMMPSRDPIQHMWWAYPIMIFPSLGAWDYSFIPLKIVYGIEAAKKKGELK